MTTTRAPAVVVGSQLFTSPSLAASNDAWAQARNAGPVVATGADDGLNVLTRHAEVSQAFRDWEQFSSARTDPDVAAITVSKSRIPVMVPQEYDPPEWQALRRSLAVHLKFEPCQQLLPRIRHWVGHYIDRIATTERCDFVEDLAVPIPMAVTMELLGFPEEEWESLATVFHETAGYPAGHPKRTAAERRFVDVIAACKRQSAERRRAPTGDLVSAMAQQRLDNGEPIPDEILPNLVMQVMGGGVDTTTSLISAALVHLGRDRELREKMRANPDLWPTATEEFLRLYPPARTFARTVTKDTEIAGCPISKGDRVVLGIASANRDARAFADPDRCNVERTPNRHLSFGLGIHRCPGVHLARLMFTETLTAVLDRFPEYELMEEGIVEYPNWGALGGWASVPAKLPT